MLTAIVFLINMSLTFLFVFIANKMDKKNTTKIIHFCRIALGVKVVIYIPCVFSLAMYLKTLQLNKLCALLPILYLSVLILIDSALFYPIIRNTRKVAIKFTKYISNTMFDVAIIFLPVTSILFFRLILPSNDLVLYLLIIFAIVSYNVFYPMLVRTKYHAKKESIDFIEQNLNNETNNHTVYIYDGKITKEANAMVCGVFPPYNILISDYLLQYLSSEETLAIIHHEFGHIKKHHLLIKNIYLASCYPVMVLIGWLMDNICPDIYKPLGILLMFSILFLYGGVLFLYISRSQEYQADKYAVKKCGNKNVLISALKKIQELNQYVSKRNMTEELLSTHPSISKRIERLK